ncbi:MAG: hypothetical protein ACRYF5_04375 [Janthinobacterium lividum]
MNPSTAVSRAAMYKLDKTQHRFPEIRRDAAAVIKEVKQEISSVLNHPLFEFLHTTARRGFTPAQFCMQSRSYLLACDQVIPLFEKAAARAKEQGDHMSLAIFEENLQEEYGADDEGTRHADKLHANLARYSHLTHASVVFGIDAVQFENAPVNPAVRTFIERQRDIYDDTNYFAVIGACYVDEEASADMMKVYFETLFEPYKQRYAGNDFAKVAQYWHEHMDELEDIHAKDIRRGLLAHCRTDADVAALRRGAHSMIRAQSALLDGVLHALQSLEGHGSHVAVDAREILALQYC